MAASDKPATGGLPNGHSNGHSNGYSNGHADAGPTDYTAGILYRNQLEAQPPDSASWFSFTDIGLRLLRALGLYYTCLVTEPITMLLFFHSYLTLWYGKVAGFVLLPLLPYWPFCLSIIELATRFNNTFNPYVKDVNWKLKGPGRIWFVPPPTLFASLLYDSFQAIQNCVGHFVLFGCSDMGVQHTFYDPICFKEFWFDVLDRSGARRPLQLAHWDGKNLINDGPGLGFGNCDIVCKISDSYLGIGDRVFKRGEDFTDSSAIAVKLEADAEYQGKNAVLSELVRPSETVRAASEGFGNVHQLDIVTVWTKANGVKVLSCVLWTDCSTWSSHSASAGYLVDVSTERVIAPTAFYAPYFSEMKAAPLVGTTLPGTLEACRKAIAAHELAVTDQPWLNAVGWDAMLTPEGPMFFEGNVASYRSPRRMFLTSESTLGFFKHLCGSNRSPSTTAWGRLTAALS